MYNKFKSKSKKRAKRIGRNKRTLKEILLHLFHPQESNKHRSRILHPQVLLYFSLIVIGAFTLVRTIQFIPGTYHSILGYAANITTMQVVEQTNQQRKLHGLEPVVYNAILSQAALSKGQDMFNEQYWAHTSPKGKEPWDFIKSVGYSYKVAGENLARDFMGTEEMTDAWMASPTHRANILNPKFEEMGIAIIDGKLKGFETTLVVQMFGTQSESAAVINKAAATTQAFAFDNGDKKDENLEITNIVIDAEYTGSELSKINLRANSVFVLGEEVSLSKPALFTPLQLTKAFFLAIIIIIVVTLFYDGIISHNKGMDRVVGKNMAHIIMLCTVAFLVIFFKGGLIQ